MFYGSFSSGFQDFADCILPMVIRGLRQYMTHETAPARPWRENGWCYSQTPGTGMPFPTHDEWPFPAAAPASESSSSLPIRHPISPYSESPSLPFTSSPPPLFVTLAKAGIHGVRIIFWIPTFVGMTAFVSISRSLYSSSPLPIFVIPAKAGIHDDRALHTRHTMDSQSSWQ